MKVDFFKRFSNKLTPKEVAKDRLKLILIHDRGICLMKPLKNKVRNTRGII